MRDLAVRAALAGAVAAQRHARSARVPPVTIETKGDDSPVTIADRESEAAIRAVIAAARPGDAWLGEETGRAEVLHPGSAPSGLCWVVDPIDGTRNFVRGIPLWAVLVAVGTQTTGTQTAGTQTAGAQTGRSGSAELDFTPLAAAVSIPGQGELYEAYLGGGARCNEATIRVSPWARLDQALFCYETPAWFRRHGQGRTFEALLEQTALSRGLTDAYGHMLVASGRAELMVEPRLSVWDVAATSLIVREAGGRFSDLHGGTRLHLGTGPCTAVVSNGHVHDAALDLIRAHEDR